MVVIESKGISDVGKKRTGNEDAMFLDDSMNLYVVADGMGGHQAGEVASSIVVETIRDYMKQFKGKGVTEELEDTDESISRGANRLVSSIHLANNGVYGLSQKNESYEGMGSTVSAVLFTDESLIAVNVGDSPIYLIHKDEIELISVPHTVLAEQAAIDPDRAKNLAPRFAHMLTRAVGIGETIKPDVCETPYFKGDILVLSSDGLSDKVAPEEILKTVGKEQTNKACSALVDLANERGGDDNITVIVLKVKDKKNQKGWFAWLMSKIGKIV
ncbi:MAG: protein phosphatase 2C domain-containing protein [Proteobacteria bacterium]|nr:protein phosphatase 2C domain-containing protein [Pseudomonadota bacterium]MBU1713056.1 protein phosphatase 2C domain-containing protein [Pseudomonadota bacterium]